MCCILISSPCALCAQKAKDFGAGGILGNPTGASAKYWIDDIRAIDMGLGYSGDFSLHVDYLWHGWKVFPQPKEGKLAGYLGLGVRLETKKKDEFGIRTVAGADYWLAHYPIEVFLEIVPVFRFTPGTSAGLDAAIGLRYYFESSR